MQELRPLVDEYQRLEKAASALAGVGAGVRGAGRRRARRDRLERSPSRDGHGRRGGRAAAASARSRRRSWCNAKPGITIPELADPMGIQANYLYRVMPGLQKDGKVRKRGKGWHPA